MEHNFWSEVSHDADKFVEHVIGMVDREKHCTGVVISNVEILDEILKEQFAKYEAKWKQRYGKGN
jgi:hypothetical protein